LIRADHIDTGQKPKRDQSTQCHHHSLKRPWGL
jgi:hypothetical protein